MAWLAWLGAATAVQAQGAAPAVEAGRVKAAACAVCHGPAGIASAPDAPHLAGMPPLYLTAQLRAYRSGARRHEVMAVIARPLSDEDIAALAAWYAAIRIEATPPAPR
ncbi:MAG: c-type cytochrome [Rubrivivax sp.]|nr:c-type cytochrome [Rubrivivax sp.]